MATDVDAAIRRLLAAGVARIEQLEVLLVIARQPRSDWDADSVWSSAMIARETVRDALEHLHRCRLVELVDPRRRSFRLDERADAAELAELARIYTRDRARVTNSFFARNLENLRSFADAFKLRRPP